MSETTSSPRDRDEDEEQGVFVGGEFGHSDNAEDGRLTSAQHEPPAHDATGDLGGDVEGISTEPAPGDRNEPV